MAKRKTDEVTEAPVKSNASTKTKGILLIALGHHNYGQMAANLAMSIKYKENIPIALYCTENATSTLTDQHKGLFDIIIPAKDDLNPFGKN